MIFHSSRARLQKNVIFFILIWKLRFSKLLNCLTNQMIQNEPFPLHEYSFYLFWQLTIIFGMQDENKHLFSNLIFIEIFHKRTVNNIYLDSPELKSYYDNIDGNFSFTFSKVFIFPFSASIPIKFITMEFCFTRFLIFSSSYILHSSNTIYPGGPCVLSL